MRRKAHHRFPYLTYNLLVVPDVANNRVDGAMRKLRRILRQEKLLKKWRDAESYKKPAEERVLQQKETALRLKKREFKESMRCGSNLIYS
jgi:ribosomal protein S21